MRTIKVKVYKFEELSEGAQQAAISDLSDINVDHEWWDIDGLLDLTQDEMNGVGIELGEIESLLLSYSIQAFDLERGQYIQFKDVVVNNEEAFRKFLKIPKDLWEQCAYYFNNPISAGGDGNTYLELIADDDEVITKEEDLILDEAVEIMGDKIHESWVSLRNDYEYHTSDEAIKDTILSNEYEFFEGGKLL